MIALYDRAAIIAALDMALPAEVLAILGDIAANDELLDLTVVLIVEVEDDEAAIVDAIGFSPLVHPIDETRYPSPTFEPYWAHLRDRGGRWHELWHCVGNEGFAYALVLDTSRDDALSAMCRQYAA